MANQNVLFYDFVIKYIYIGFCFSVGRVPCIGSNDEFKWSFFIEKLFAYTMNEFHAAEIKIWLLNLLLSIIM